MPVEFTLTGRISIVGVTYGANCDNYHSATRVENAALSSLTSSCDDLEVCKYLVTDQLFYFSKVRGDDPYPECFADFRVTYQCDPEPDVYEANVCGVKKQVTIDCSSELILTEALAEVHHVRICVQARHQRSILERCVSCHHLSQSSHPLRRGTKPSQSDFPSRKAAHLIHIIPRSRVHLRTGKASCSQMCLT